MNTRWTLESERASQTMKWYDIVTIVVLAVSGIVAVFAWVIFDGRLGEW